MSDIMLPTNPDNVNETEVLCQGRRPGDTGYGTSRYRAKCPACKQMIEQGDKIEIYSRPGKRNRWKHADCKSAGKPNRPTPAAPASPAGSDVSNALIADLVKRITELENRPAAESIEIRQPDDHVIRIEGKTHSVFPRVLQLAAARKPVFLPGPSGCGKSHLGGQVAEALELRFASISCSAGMSEAQLLGRLVPRGENGQFQFVGTEFLDCFENGGVFLFDEIDAADPNVLLVINAALANGFVTVANRPENPTAKRHPEFVCIAAANTFGRGADRLYVGRNELDDATLDQLLDFIDSRLAELRALDTTATDRTKHIAEATLGLVDNIDAAAQTESHRGIRTGLECFDRVNGGFQNGTLNVIAARPSNGKSVLAMQFAEGISRGFEFSLSDGGNYFTSRQPAIPTMFVSLEMTE